MTGMKPEKTAASLLDSLEAGLVMLHATTSAFAHLSETPTIPVAGTNNARDLMVKFGDTGHNSMILVESLLLVLRDERARQKNLKRWIAPFVIVAITACTIGGYAGGIAGSKRGLSEARAAVLAEYGPPPVLPPIRGPNAN